MENKKIFKTGNWFIECKTTKTRNGFIHTAVLKNEKNGAIYGRARVNCLRTWESFEYEEVIKQLLDKTKILNEKEKKEIITQAEKEGSKDLKLLGIILKMADLSINNLKEKNKQKIKILKIRFGNAFILPDNWEELPENEKENRLKKIEEFLLKNN